MKISVIIPVRNGAKTLRRCVSGYLRQGAEDLELILVENGSADGTWELCRELAREDNRIRLFRREEPGVSGARNLGLRYSSGGIIGFADADDEPADGLLEWVRQTFLRHPEVGVLVTGITKVLPDGREIVKRHRRTRIVSFRKLARLALHDSRISGYSPNKFWRRECLEGIFFREDLSHGEDIHFVVNALMHAPGRRGMILPVSGYRYYQHGESATGAKETMFDEQDRLNLIRGARGIRRDWKLDWWTDLLVGRLIFSMASSQYLRDGLTAEQRGLLARDMQENLGCYLATAWTEPAESAGRMHRLIRKEMKEGPARRRDGRE